MILTWAVNGADTVVSQSLAIDGNPVGALFGPYGPNPNGSYYLGGSLGSLGAGVHTYAITSTDGKGNSGSLSGSFTVADASGLQVSNVVVAEDQLPRNGVLESNEQLVITWTLTGPDAATTAAANTSLSVDGNTVTAKYGPYGTVNSNAYNWAGVFGSLSAGVHSYTIVANDSNGNAASYSGSFSVSSAGGLLLEASAPPSDNVNLLTDQQLQPIIAEAEVRLTAALGLRATASLSGISVLIADLPGNMLGEVIDDTIYISRTGAKYGWFVDQTPDDDVEFSDLLGPNRLGAGSLTSAAQRADLLTTVMHEMGHVLGYNHAATDGLMSAILSRGERRTVDYAITALFE